MHIAFTFAFQLCNDSNERIFWKNVLIRKKFDRDNTAVFVQTYESFFFQRYGKPKNCFIGSVHNKGEFIASRKFLDFQRLQFTYIALWSIRVHLRITMEHLSTSMYLYGTSLYIYMPI